MPVLNKRNNKKPVVFFDFDNTITTFDVLDDLLMNYSIDKNWVKLEEKWKRGEIGSRECLEGQLRNIRISKEELDKYLKKIKIDPYFSKLTDYFSSRKIKILVLSDNFDYILKRILGNNKIKNLEVYSNKLKLSNNKLIPKFDFESKFCKLCAHCKKENLHANIDKNSMPIYIGDGMSDICPSKHSEVVFAKEGLLKYCRLNKLDCIPYKTLRDVYIFFIGRKYEQNKKSKFFKS